jgi:GntR family transcriptional regulator
MTAGFLFHVLPSSGVPIYRQLVEQIRAAVAGGRMPEGAFLPSVRQVAEDLQINPMTVSKAYSLLAHDGTCELVRGQGMRISGGQQRGTLKERQDEVLPQIRQLIALAYHLDLSRDQVIELLKKHWGQKI